MTEQQENYQKATNLVSKTLLQDKHLADDEIKFESSKNSSNLTDERVVEDKITDPTVYPKYQGIHNNTVFPFGQLFDKPNSKSLMNYKKFIASTDNKVKKLGIKKINQTKIDFLGSTTKMNSGKYSRRPSKIPKLSRPNQINHRDNIKIQILDNNKSPKMQSVCHEKGTQTDKHSTEYNRSCIQGKRESNKIGCIQEKLKQTIFTINQKFGFVNKLGYKRVSESIESSNSLSVLSSEIQNNDNLGYLYSKMSQLKETALALSSNINNFKSQKNYIECLLRDIMQIKKIAGSLTKLDNNNIESIVDFRSEINYNKTKKLENNVGTSMDLAAVRELVSEIVDKALNANK